MNPMNTEFAVIQNDECSLVSDLASFRDFREEETEDVYGDDDDMVVVRPCSEIRTKSLYGRTSEQLKLLTAYQDLLHTHQAKKVILHGVSGSGKTALVNSVRDPIIQNGGYFVTGKFFQGADLHEPHSAIVSAFSDICDLVAQSDDISEMEISKIQEELGTDGQILKRFISNLSPFLLNDISNVDYADDNFFDYRKESTLAQFKVACKVFLRVMATAKHPIVIFIDDIQWMDDGSKDLIHTLLMKDTNLSHVMIILSYRDEEKQSVLDLLQSSSLSFIDIPLGNLDVSSVHQIVTEILASNSSNIRDLSNLVMEKSNGNPLHVMLFLETIQRQKFLVHDDRCNTWIFDVGRIEDAVHISGTFSDLLSRKIAIASSDTVDVLKIASVIGYSFESSVLLIVYQKLRSNAFPPPNDCDTAGSPIQVVQDSLSDALQLGFIVTSSAEGMYAFTHDKIQSAFQALNSVDYTSHLHFRIGEVHSERGHDGLDMYNTAVHWNAASNYLKGRYHKPKLARINLEAAKYCHEKAAFARAATLLRTGLSLLDKHERWESKYLDLTLKIVEMLAKMELIIGNFEACKQITENAVSHVISIERKINFLLIDVEARMTAFESDSALESAVNALGCLGIKMPLKVTCCHVVWKLCWTKLYLRNKADKDILSLPMMTDKATSAAVRILVLMCTYCLLNNKICQAMYSALLAIRLTTKCGLSPYSANAFAIYGVAEIALRNYDKGYRFGRLALKLGDHMKSRDAECATMAFTLTFLSFWKDSIHDLKDVLLRSGTSGYEVGDIMYGKLKSSCLLSECVKSNFTFP
jgi:predicted ATPase